MKEIPLTQGHVALVDDEDYPELSRYRWHVLKEPKRRVLYAARKEPCSRSGKYGQDTIRMHRQIMRAPKGQGVDHKDGDGLNNRRRNLRFATSAQNSANKALIISSNKSGRRGVHWDSAARQWRARIGRNQRYTHLGFFDDLNDAARAYDAAARELFGEFARLNFPELVAEVGQ